MRVFLVWTEDYAYRHSSLYFALDASCITQNHHLEFLGKVHFSQEVLGAHSELRGCTHTHRPCGNLKKDLTFEGADPSIFRLFLHHR